jgi:hypothetical protein
VPNGLCHCPVEYVVAVWLNRLFHPEMRKVIKALNCLRNILLDILSHFVKIFVCEDGVLKIAKQNIVVDLLGYRNHYCDVVTTLR